MSVVTHTGETDPMEPRTRGRREGIVYGVMGNHPSPPLEIFLSVTRTLEGRDRSEGQERVLKGNLLVGQRCRRLIPTWGVCTGNR